MLLLTGQMILDLPNSVMKGLEQLPADINKSALFGSLAETLKTSKLSCFFLIYQYPNRKRGSKPQELWLYKMESRSGSFPAQ
jgi:hypothetical protein